MLRLSPMFPNYFEATRRRGAGRLRWSGARTTTRGCPCLCAHAPGRIDGVLVALVIVVLITTHSACLVMRAAQGACPIWHADWQMAGLVGAFAAAQAARESNRPLLELFRDCLEISFQADDGPRPRDEGANQGDTRPTISRTTRRRFGFDHCPTDHVTAAAPARLSPATPTP